MPLEGGLYQWAKLGFNEMTGFLVAWNLWLFAILNTSETGLQLTQYVVVHRRAGRRALDERPRVIVLVSAAIFSALVWLAIRGLSFGKWVHKSGGVLMLGTFAMLLVVPWLNVAKGTLPAFHPLATAAPVVSLMSLNLLGKMGFGALGRFRVRGDSRRRVPKPGADDRRVGGDRRADHRRSCSSSARARCWRWCRRIASISSRRSRRC